MSDQEPIEAFLERKAPFSGFSRTERESLAATMTLHSWPAQSVVLEQGSTGPEPVYLVVSGRLQVSDALTEGLLRTIGEGGVVGQYAPSRGDDPLPFQVETLVDSTLALIPAEVFARLYEAHSRVAAFFDGEATAFSRQEVTLQDLSGTQFLFGTRLRDLVHREPPQCSPHASVYQAARLMVECNCGYLVVSSDTQPLGLLTDRELRGHMACGAADVPVIEVMNTNPVSLGARHSLFDALLSMLQTGATHIVVRVGANGPLVGVIDAQDVARAQGYSPLMTLEQIAQARSVESLPGLRNEADGLLQQLYQRGVPARDLVSINTLINDRLTGRVLELSEAAFADSRPQLDFSWTWLSLGSEGRGEMCLNTDQDNALVYEAPRQADADVQRWLGEWASNVNRSLDGIGLTTCDAGMMAGNRDWRHRPSDWRKRFDEWASRSRGPDVMQLSSVCDLRAIRGPSSLEKAIKVELLGSLRAYPRFLKHMAEGVLGAPSALTPFPRRIRTRRTEQGRMINIKRTGVQPFSDFARIMALRNGYLDSSGTLDRLDYLEAEQPGLRDTLRSAREGWQHIIDIRLGHHLQCVANGRPVDDWVSIDDLGSTRRDMLKVALASIDEIQGVLAQRFSLQLRW